MLRGSTVTARPAVTAARTPAGPSLLNAMRQARPPEIFERTPSSIRRVAPLLGEHTDEVLGEAGFSTDEIAELRAGGALPATA